MGFAKYHEDDLEIFDDRMYYRNTPSVPCLYTYSKPKQKIKYNCYCPFCKNGFMKFNELVSHVFNTHGGIHEFVYLNNKRVYNGEYTVQQVFSLKLYSFRDEPREIKLTDGMGKSYVFHTNSGQFEYDIHGLLEAQLYSEIRIDNIDAPVLIRQQLDINAVSMDNIFSSKYHSYLFDDQVSDEKLNINEYLIYLKMLIYEGEDTSGFIERISYMNLDYSRDLDELYYYHCLSIGYYCDSDSKINKKVFDALLALLNGEFSEADKLLGEVKEKNNDKDGCKIIFSLLKHDTLGTDFLVRRYEKCGIIGSIVKILLYFADYEKSSPDLLINEFDNLKLFMKYPLINALNELNESLNKRGSFSSESYKLIRDLSPLVPINYCYSIDDDEIKEKILKSMVKTYKNSALIKEYAFDNNYSWLKRRIYVTDGELYRKHVLKINSNRKKPFSDSFINSFPFDDQIRITPLGGECAIGASCFVISYKGYNIMLDCGIDVQKSYDNAYPQLDTWDKDIDTIIISHAHIDHSGGVPKAHAMWPKANIICTSPTKVFLKYLYADMAKVKNGITDEFEIENISIEKEVMFDTLSSINTVDFLEWVTISKDIKIRLHPAGHIVGAAMIELWVDGKTILYTGDYCNYNQQLTGNYNLNSLPDNVDYLITESTYMKKSKVDWNRQHDDIKNKILKAINSGDSILFPAAAIGRSQELMCIIGEMKLNREIPDDYTLFIGGMAIPATTQIIPFMNERYQSIISQFEEFDGVNFPDGKSIVIASSGSMTKGSASYKVSKHWDSMNIRYIIIANGNLDEETECDSRYLDMKSHVQRMSLSTHTDMKGVFDLIDYVSPRVISFVHRGSDSEKDILEIENTCLGKFSNDVVLRGLKLNRCDKIFDINEWFMEEEK